MRKVLHLRKLLSNAVKYSQNGEIIHVILQDNTLKVEQKGVVIKPSVNIKYPWNLKIGDYVWIGENVWIDNLVEVSIGDNVCISQGAMLLCGNHNYKKTSFDLMVGKIMIEAGAWVGAQSVVCPKVTIHSHAVLAVGSVASHDLDEYAVYQGNPAIKVRDRKIL